MITLTEHKFEAGKFRKFKVYDNFQILFQKYYILSNFKSLQYIINPLKCHNFDVQCAIAFNLFAPVNSPFYLWQK